MSPRLCLLLGLLAAFLLVIISAKDLSQAQDADQVATESAGEEEDGHGGRGGYPGGGGGGYPGGGYPGRGGGGGGYPGGGGGGYPGRGGGGGGYPGHGGGGGGGKCRYGCCGRGYYNRGCKCCSYAGEAVTQGDQP